MGCPSCAACARACLIGEASQRPELLIGDRDDVGGVVRVQSDAHRHRLACIRIDSDRLDGAVDVRPVVRLHDVHFGEQTALDREHEVVLGGRPVFVVSFSGHGDSSLTSG